MARPKTTEPRKPDDARAKRSIAALQDALLVLLENKSLDQISIRSITDQAGLSEMTFYRRFASKEDLLQHIATEEVRTLLALGEEAVAAEPQGATFDVCDYVQSRRSLWKVLLTGGAVSAMRDEFARISAGIGAARPGPNRWIPSALAVSLVTSSIFEILAWWMRQDESYPIEDVRTLIQTLVYDNVRQPRDVKMVSKPDH